VNNEAMSILEDDLRERIHSEALLDPPSLYRVAKDVVRKYRERAVIEDLPSIADDHSDGEVAGELIKRLSGFGALSDLLEDPRVEEIWVNSPGAVFISRGGGHERVAIHIGTKEIRDLVEKMLGFTGKRIDRASPFVDAILPDGSRLHVVIPPVTQHWTINVRKFTGIEVNDLGELVARGSLSLEASEFLAAAVEVGLNIVVAGAVGAGKTTMLNCLASAIPPSERVVTCEEIFELDIEHPDIVGMQCRQPNFEGEGEIPLRRLVKESLRMRPDRIIVGEVRGAEAFDMLISMNAGCAAMTSVHANTAREAVRKLTALPLLAGENISKDFITSTVAACIDLVVFCRRERRSGFRYVDEILAIGEQVGADGVTASPIFRREGNRLRWTGEFPRNPGRFEESGIDLLEILKYRQVAEVADVGVGG
jgi:pilus assembly protein CpaF